MSKNKVKKLSLAELSGFCRQIGMVLTAGLPIYYGISILMDDTEDADTKALYEQIYKPMESGSTLTAAIQETGVFPEYMIQMVKLGEETGRLDNVLASLADYYDREAEIRNGIRHAAVYPLIMTVLMIAVIIVLMTKVLPIFSQVYEELGTELTGVARTLLNISSGMNRYLAVILIVFAVLIVIAIVLFNTPLGQRLFDRSKISMSIAASRFSNCMYLALASGLDTDTGLEMAYNLVNNQFMKERIEKCRNFIKNGESFEDSIRDADIFSKSYSSWIAIGYRTGGMEDVMRRISNAYEEESDERIASAVSTIEPTLVIVLCFFVGLILISFLLPLLGIMQSIG